MSERKYIWIGLTLLQKANVSKKRIEALAFAILIKQRFVSSVYIQINYEELSIALHVGKEKIKRIIKDAEQYGYISRKHGRIIANKIKNSDGQNEKVFIDKINSLNDLIIELKKI